MKRLGHAFGPAKSKSSLQNLGLGRPLLVGPVDGDRTGEDGDVDAGLIRKLGGESSAADLGVELRVQGAADLEPNAPSRGPNHSIGSSFGLDFGSTGRSIPAFV